MGAPSRDQNLEQTVVKRWNLIEFLTARRREARAEITQRNALKSPLLRLPAEIRNLIYNYVLTKGTMWYS
ncbi:hypothetical protein HBI05_025670 [Parastagonospora nodorum]|nr:hypothetical protein HBI05_025670 [Parastagonospora nodorum]KAH4326569.1 hypothetical protein HBI00_138580 [Parastagonospora nodorum]